MKRFSAILSVLALVVLMQGCGKGVEPETPNNPVQLRLKGNISAIAPSTRVNADGFEADDKVGVYISATGALASSGNILDNEAFTYSSGNLNAPEGKEIFWNSEDDRLSVWAYYPYPYATSVENLAEYPFAVAADQSVAVDYYDSDFITAQAANLAPQATPVELTFNHSLSKIKVTLVAGEGIKADELAEAEKNFYISGLITSGTIDLATGTATAGEAKERITPLASESVNYEAIVYPQQGEVSFRLEMDGDVYAYSTDISYTAGMQYDYKLKIIGYIPQQMILESTTITPWGDGGEEHEGVMEEENISFADPKFKEYLLQETLHEVTYYVEYGNYGTWAVQDTGTPIDSNNDGEISIAEAEKVERIDVSYLGISDMRELVYFTNLKRLACHNNQLTSLDVSKNIALMSLSCANNQLASLDVSKNTALVDLACLENQLTSLDVSQNTALTLLNCGSNQLTTLDISMNTALVDLRCYCNQLTSLDISKNTVLFSLNCFMNQLTTLDVSNNTALKDLNCQSNKLTTLNVSKNTALTNLACDGNQLNTLNLSNNTELMILSCSSNQLTSLDVSKNTSLRQLSCSNNQLNSLNLSYNLEILECSNNQLTSLDVLTNMYLLSFSCNGNQLTSLDVSNNTALTDLHCCGNQLTTLDVSNNTALIYLRCNPMNDEQGNNLLTTIYTAEGHEFETLEKPEETVIEYK